MKLVRNTTIPNAHHAPVTTEDLNLEPAFFLYSLFSPIRFTFHFFTLAFLLAYLHALHLLIQPEAWENADNPTGPKKDRPKMYMLVHFRFHFWLILNYAS